MNIRFYTSIQNLRNGLDELDHRNIDLNVGGGWNAPKPHSIPFPPDQEPPGHRACRGAVTERVEESKDNLVAGVIADNHIIFLP